MTKVQAVIREQQLEAVIERLALLGVYDLTLTNAHGAGRSQGRREVFRGGAYQVTLLPKVLIEWYGPDEQVDAVVRAIAHRARTGKIGDGKIFVQRVDEGQPIPGLPGLAG
jgi:nitrogen regulatory protein P-II 1